MMDGPRVLPGEVSYASNSITQNPQRINNQFTLLYTDRQVNAYREDPHSLSMTHSLTATVTVQQITNMQSHEPGLFLFDLEYSSEVSYV